MIQYSPGFCASSAPGGGSQIAGFPIQLKYFVGGVRPGSHPTHTSPEQGDRTPEAQLGLSWDISGGEKC